MKTLNQLLVFSLLLLCLNSFSQRLPLDVRRVIVTNKYVLKDGKNTNVFFPIYQEIFDSLGRLHTEIDFDFPDRYPHNYKWHTFKGKQIVKTEVFENEKLKFVKSFTYTQDSLISTEIDRSIGINDTVILTLSYKYNTQKKPILIEAKTIQNKIAYTVKSKYDSNGSEISRSVKMVKGYCPFDSILKLTNKPKYDSLNRLISNVVSIEKMNKKKGIRSIQYSYDNKNNLIQMRQLDKNGKQISREERIYQEKRNRLMSIKYYNASDSLVMWLAKRYEIYKTKNRTEQVIDY